jgi:S1-C subfamily serine protease
LQIDASVQPGDSGGPLLNSLGEVIGMDTAAAQSDFSGVSIGFAIPIDHARVVATDIVAGRSNGQVTLGESPFLGIVEQPGGGVAGTGLGATGAVQSPVGVEVGYVIQGSPAVLAGLRSGDVITAIDQSATTSWAKVQALIGARRPGQSITVSYVDQSKAIHTATVTLIGVPR